MEPERAVRVALARLVARRFGRAVPEAEIRRELGVQDVRPALESLARQGLVWATPQGWSLTSPPLATRAKTECASLAWLHYA